MHGRVRSRREYIEKVFAFLLVYLTFHFLFRKIFIHPSFVKAHRTRPQKLSSSYVHRREEEEFNFAFRSLFSEGKKCGQSRWKERKICTKLKVFHVATTRAHLNESTIVKKVHVQKIIDCWTFFRSSHCTHKNLRFFIVHSSVMIDVDVNVKGECEQTLKLWNTKRSRSFAKRMPV